ncbi:hypothetical protein BH11PSE8_BH11PSE8_31950 [soil metagenome]
MNQPLHLIALTLGAVLATSAGAQAVYRCGNIYSHKPCSDARAIEADDARSPEQRSEARRIAADEKQQAHHMERERVDREKATKPALATGFDSRAKKPDAPASLFTKPKHKKKRYTAMQDAKGDDFIAVAPSAKKKRAEK